MNALPNNLISHGTAVNNIHSVKLQARIGTAMFDQCIDRYVTKQISQANLYWTIHH